MYVVFLNPQSISSLVNDLAIYLNELSRPHFKSPPRRPWSPLSTCKDAYALQWPPGYRVHVLKRFGCLLEVQSISRHASCIVHFSWRGLGRLFPSSSLPHTGASPSMQVLFGVYLRLSFFTPLFTPPPSWLILPTIA